MKLAPKFTIPELFDRYVKNSFPSKEKAFEILAQPGRTLYWGTDPTGPNLHLGHSTNLLLLKNLIAHGHHIILLIGDFTAQIGDPTDRDATRRPLSEKEIKENMRDYLDQVYKIIPKKFFKIEYNSKWYKKFSFSEVIKLASHVSVQQMLARDMFQERIKKERTIGLHEFLYPLVQGYDSVMLKVDGEIGGNDQTFNMLVGRDLEKELVRKDKMVIATLLLEDPTTGKKMMNKSEGQYISLRDSASDMYGKIMAMPDSAILPLWKLCTEESLPSQENISAQPKTTKEQLALIITRMYHGEKDAQRVRKQFRSIFSEGQLPTDIPEIEAKETLLQTVVAAGLVPSISEGKRLINQGAIAINDIVVKRWDQPNAPRSGDIIKIGPHTFRKIR
ncbi:MAG: tyrosine--tRNA ligase [Candidatus Yanofskybacteria bacterium RIFCSPHIGHO2_01_FULL_45_42]|uniref:Tyrosine--tRNA ligase n=2 Tax=Candidatus Yanofskyibacteriota TaxID=1752733 RepID=A0A1F8F3S8_9BACT|nr:MAG: tyrosine--tRNA ligase [Candidatus Yanofskybacteria bacterium RIFCSPHIGHO2_01_FULL_45_42]OGN26629.1 MAG: tyrosine--tRNA ligase [Candidatus Yanofskybacteria bacterium RIFCSPLOWO2_01_FULL_45_72]OGN31972.1 MAG: tyrosine--tRNA ligase [Candidatus Yanofskybacteria bacterium RIFCSPLOWO2_02_FULL_45_18]